ncbi:MAG TPA: aminotransferase class I/II-fold pyridoxal phosphate-dependent enzyme, partial [Desulfobacteria bacterium]|nr:aminotransferase class I/II-fold pyridoxal phosphate-dependent enzyme [Desulfobacteria bacterium]
MAAIRHIHGGNIWQAEEKYGLTGKELVDFSANINPLGPSSKVLEAITSNMELITAYPDPEVKALKKAVSEWTGIPTDSIIAGNGAIEIIYLLMKLVSPGEALIPAPTFNEYEISVQIA